MNLHDFSFQLLGLLRENFKLADVILRMLIRIVIPQLSCNQQKAKRRIQSKSRVGSMRGEPCHPGDQCVCPHGSSWAEYLEWKLKMHLGLSNLWQSSVWYLYNKTPSVIICAGQHCGHVGV